MFQIKFLCWGKSLKDFHFWDLKQKKNSKTFCFLNIMIKWANDLYETLTWFWNSKTTLLIVLLPILKLPGFHSCSSPITFVKFHRYSFTARDGASKPIKNVASPNVLMWKNHTHVKRVGEHLKISFWYLLMNLKN